MPSPHTAEWPPRYPAPLDPADVPEHLRGNTLVQALLEMSPTDAAACEASARSDAADDAETVALLLADAR